MRAFRPMLLVALLGLSLAAPAAVAGEDGPQQSSIGEVLARLSVDDPAERAWGCYLAGRDGHADAIPAVVDVLRHHVESPEKTWRLVHRAALDALIRLDAQVPSALLARHDGHAVIHVLVLRARDPKAHVAGLEARFDRTLKGEKIGLFGLAVGNLLLQVRPEGFAADLLGTLHATLRIHVSDPDWNGGIGLGRSVGGGFGDSVARVPEGFPPYSWYGLKGEARPGHSLLAPGPRPVYVKRRERASPGMVGGGRAFRLNPTDTCLEWIAALLGKDAESLVLPKERSAYVTWTDAAAYVAQVTKARESMLASWWTIVRQLLDAGLLSQEEVVAHVPQIELLIQDTRKDQGEALPDLPSVPRPAWAIAPDR